MRYWLKMGLTDKLNNILIGLGIKKRSDFKEKAVDGDKQLIETYCNNCEDITMWNFNRYVGIAPCHGGPIDIPVYQCRGCDNQNILKNLNEYQNEYLKELKKWIKKKKEKSIMKIIKKQLN